jgi:DNA-binding transcriptional MerR regulator
VAAKTIRFYEDVGVLPAPSRSASGYRRYDQSGVERLRFLRRARSLGLPLHRLKTLTTTLNGGLRPQIRKLVREQISAVEHQLAELELLRQQLEEISRRMVTAGPRSRTGACRCLETADDSGRPRPRGRSSRRAT